MVWFKVDDNLSFHAKVVAAGNPAMGLWVRAGAWSAQQLTEGFVPSHIAATMGTRGEAKRLVDSGLWLAEPGGYRFWQWHKDGRQPTREQVEAKRAAARERQQRARDKAQASRRDDGVTDAVTEALVTVPPTRPDPTKVEEQLGGDRPVTLRPANATEPPDEICTRHPDGNPKDEPCQGCKAVNERKARRIARLDAKARRELEQAIRDCPDCLGSLWHVNPDGSPVEPPRQCSHRNARKTA